MKKLRNITIVLFALFAVLLATGWVIGNYYEKEVKEAVLSRLNEHLRTEVEVEDIDLTLIRKFPYASLHLSDVLTKEVAYDGQQADTLFYCNDLYLQFDIIDVFRKNHRLEKISVENGLLYPSLDEKGQENYRFWKTSKGGGDSLIVELEHIRFRNMAIHYQDLQHDRELKGKVNDLHLKGAFDKNVFTLDTEGDAFIQAYREKDHRPAYLSKKAIFLDADVDIDTEKLVYRIEDGIVALGEARTNASGNFRREEGEWFIDVHLNTEGQRIKDIRMFLPSDLRENFEHHRIKGFLAGSAWIRGPLSSGTPRVDVDFSLENARIEHLITDVSMKNISIEGMHSSGHVPEEGRLVIMKSSGNIGGGSIKASGKLTNFADPEFQVDLKAKVEAQELLRFFELDTLQDVKGELVMDGKFNGPLSWFDEMKDDLKTSGQVAMKNAAFRLKESEKEYRDLNGTVVLKGRDARVNHLRGKVGNSDFELNGTLRGLFPWLIDKEKELVVDAGFHADHLDLNEWLDQETAERDTTYRINFPERIRFKLKVGVNELVFRDFQAENIKGKFSLNDRVLLAHPLDLRTSGGKITLDLKMDKRSRGTLGVHCDAYLAELNIREVFRQFENFGQDFIESRHLKGDLAAKVNFKSVLKPDFTLDLDRTSAVCDFRIRKGELIQFEPMIQVGDYLKEKKLVAGLIDVNTFREKLHHIEFNTLQDRITIKNNKVNIPNLQIRSTAMNVNASGTHWFDNRIDYHFDFQLSELMTKEETSEFGYIRDEEDGKTIFVRMTGTADDPEVGWDKQLARQERKKELNEEKRTIKSALRDEFGLFKNDTTLKTSQETQEKDDGPVFEVEWDGDGEEDEEEGGSEIKDPESRNNPSQKTKSQNKVSNGEEENKEKEGGSIWDKLMKDRVEKEKVDEEFDDGDDF